MAQDCKLSVRQLQRCFNRDVGPGPREWIHDQRLLLSRRLLLEKASIKEVSLMLHYRDQSEFTHAFKRLFKVTPSEYIRRFWDSWLNHRSKPEEGEDAARP
jgi:AraC family carnitine catabolism transcriptional activator